MGTCASCGEQVEEGFAACWKCGAPAPGAEGPRPREADDARPEPSALPVSPDFAPRSEPERNPVRCLLCRRALDFVGTKAFHEGTRWGVLGELGELFVNRQRFDVYCCPRCGRVELFVDGIGEEFRSR